MTINITTTISYLYFCVWLWFPDCRRQSRFK